MYTEARAAFEAEDYRRALSLFRSLQREHPRNPHAVRAWEYIAQCENALGNPFDAFEAYQRIWDEHKDFPQLSVITRNQMAIGNYYLQNKRYAPAIKIYQQILRNAPFSDVAAAARYSLAHAFIGEKDYDAAKHELDTLIKNYPTSQLVDDAAFDLGYIDYLRSSDIQYDQTATDNAIAAFRRFIHNFPSSRRVPEAQQYIRELRTKKARSLFRMGEFYYNIRAPKAAQLAFQEVIEQYPDTALADEARVRLGELDRTGVRVAERTRQVREMETLRRHTEDATQREQQRQEALRQRLTDVQETSPPVTRRTPRVPSRLASARDEEIARVRTRYSTPQSRELLRESMKEAYTEELKRTRATAAAWRRAQRTLLADARDRAQTMLDERDAPLREAPPALEREAPSSHTDRAARDTDARSISPPIETLALVEEELPEDVYDDAVVVEETRTVRTEEVEQTTQDLTGEFVSSLFEEGTTTEIEAPATLQVSEPDTREEPTWQETEPTPREEPMPVEDISDESPGFWSGLFGRSPREEPTDDEEMALARERVREQQRAAETRARVESRRTSSDSTWERRQIPGSEPVHRAAHVEGSERVRETEYNTDALRSEYAAIYYEIQRGDTAYAQGLVPASKRHYGEALERLLDLRERAPGWQSDIVNFRIEYCRARLRSTE